MSFNRFLAGATLYATIALGTWPVHAEEQTWTLDPIRSTLTINATTNATLQWQPQVPGSNVAQFSGVMTADRIFHGDTGKTTLTFNGGDVIDAVLHSSAPFLPTGAETAGVEDNYGFLVPVGGATAQGNLRDLKFDISGGTVTVGEQGNASVDPIAGILNYRVQDGATFQFLNVLQPAASTSAIPITLVKFGGQETLTIPWRLNYVFQLTGAGTPFPVVQADIVGQWVGTRGLLGDFSGNNIVGPEDYFIWKGAYGTSNPAADANGDGTVNAADYTIWRNRLAGLPAGGALAGNDFASAVPEPTTALLLFAAGSLLLTSRRLR